MRGRIDRATLTLAAAGVLSGIGVLIPDLGLAIAVVLLGVLAGGLLIDRVADLDLAQRRFDRWP